MRNDIEEVYNFCVFCVFLFVFEGAVNAYFLTDSLSNKT